MRPLYVVEKSFATFGVFSLIYTITEHYIMPFIPKPGDPLLKTLNPGLRKIQEPLEERVSRLWNEWHDIMFGDGVDQRKDAKGREDLFDDIERPHSGDHGERQLGQDNT